MNFFKHVAIASTFFLAVLKLTMALEETDKEAIHHIIRDYTTSWNQNGCKGFSDGFTEDADFVNIFGMHFSGREEIEERHIQILQSFFKDTVLDIEKISLREARPGVVIALVNWKLRSSFPIYLPKVGRIEEGIFLQMFIQIEDQWRITASQNTLIR